MKDYRGFTPAQRTKAGRWLRERAKAGLFIWPTCCDACGQTQGLFDAHSEDYSQPYGPHIGAYGLCYLCHMMLHCRFKAPGAWAEYRFMLREGARFAPCWGRDFDRVRALLSGIPDSAYEIGEARPDLIIDRIKD